MSEFTFEKGQPIYYTPEHTGKAVIAFTVASVNDDGQAMELELKEGAPTPSAALNIGIKKTGATSGTLDQNSGNIVLSHGHKPTSPYFDEGRHFS